MKKAATEEWAVIMPHSTGEVPLGFTCNAMRKYSIQSMLRLHQKHPYTDWRYWKRRGFRCVRVSIREL